MHYIIDRFEGSFAICEQENGGFLTIPRFELPADCKEGDCLTHTEQGYRLDHKETRARAKRIQEKLNNLFE
ncbi:DUF3006 domain-containing protein [Anaerosporobacter faecicola]|uniref:DUF3006 domain-containing protein n=1 Tax=Anaerosporobacter faecicola TaxID=2718714 RepID=UPI00143B7E91|nr:DUF3006 domain-containing protein [Anaerosporobacter faecicola]